MHHRLQGEKVKDVLKLRTVTRTLWSVARRATMLLIVRRKTSMILLYLSNNSQHPHDVALVPQCPKYHPKETTILVHMSNNSQHHHDAALAPQYPEHLPKEPRLGQFLLGEPEGRDQLLHSSVPKYLYSLPAAFRYLQRTVTANRMSKVSIQ